MRLDLTWKPLASPHDPLYKEVLEEVARAPAREGAALFRAVCEKDFPFFVLHVHTFGRYLCHQPNHPHFDKPWATWPWQWERLIEIHYLLIQRKKRQFINWPRGHHKTACLTEAGATWLLARNPLETVLVVTWKMDKTGEGIHKAVRSEWEKNERLHWFWGHTFSPEAGARYTDKTLVVNRPPGPREPSFQVAGIDNAPVSQHPSCIIVDDAVVRDTVKTAESIVSTSEALDDLVAISGQDAWIVYVGTIWKLADPWMQMVREDKVERKHWACYYPAEKGAKTRWDHDRPVLFTKEHLLSLKKAQGPYRFSAHYLGEPIPDEDQDLQASWLTYYETESREDRFREAHGKHCYLVFDTAEGRSSRSDYGALAIVGLGRERSIYILDLYRDHYNLVETVDLVFELNDTWPLKMTYIDGYRGSAPFLDAILDRQRREGWRFPIRMLPSVNDAKEERIQHLVPIFSAGRLYLPTSGFGRGSKRDTRDVLKQFIEDEYSLWSAKGSSGGYDDVLDCLAWLGHPETRHFFRYPTRAVDSANRRRWRKARSPEDLFATPGVGYPRDETGVPAGVSPWAS